MVCKRLTYFGRVQGVGFRYTARALAEGFTVAGFVRNQPDGTVELMVEGELDQVEAFLNALNERLADNIRRVNAEDQPPGGYQDFVIRR